MLILYGSGLFDKKNLVIEVSGPYRDKWSFHFATISKLPEAAHD